MAMRLKSSSLNGLVYHDGWRSLPVRQGLGGSAGQVSGEKGADGLHTGCLVRKSSGVDTWGCNDQAIITELTHPICPKFHQILNLEAFQAHIWTSAF